MLERTHDLATGRNFAALTTLLPDGTPQTQMMWVDADEEHILMNTEIHRRKYHNLERDPRATIMIMEEGNPWSYVEVRGTVVEKIHGPSARTHIDRLAQKYLDQDYPYPIQSERVILKIRPDREVVFPSS